MTKSIKVGDTISFNGKEFTIRAVTQRGEHLRIEAVKDHFLFIFSDHDIGHTFDVVVK